MCQGFCATIHFILGNHLHEVGVAVFVFLLRKQNLGSGKETSPNSQPHIAGKLGLASEAELTNFVFKRKRADFFSLMMTAKMKAISFAKERFQHHLWGNLVFSSLILIL